MRYFIIGFMGCGKTYWANQWGKAYGLNVFDLDVEIEKAERKTIDMIFKEKGEDVFRQIERKMLNSLLRNEHFIMSSGGGTPCFFDNMKQMNEAGITIYLKSNPQLLAHRLQTEKETRPLIKDIDDDALEDFISQKLNSRLDCYSKAMYHLPAQFVKNENFERIRFRHEKP